jgi:hydrogenase-4 membrane subunit HyfE
MAAGTGLALASGTAQELCFRACLLDAVENLVGKKYLALALHRLVFLGIHLRTNISNGLQTIALLTAVALFIAAVCGAGRSNETAQCCG